ncbi:MAG: hypothetical protein QOG64_166 [Acidimicrobiaceae bacterium]|jgi:threonine dehydrogenase-like Zn-dependent dehydrogenase|nr:hypothetical protein [Acidimicrobiaceae bacterium]
MPGMRAAVMRNKQMVVDDVPEPVPGFGQVLVRTVACGICGSDLHFLRHGDRMAELAAQTGGPTTLDLTKDIVMGHEFTAEVLESGPDTAGPKAGTIVTSMPVVIKGFSIEDISAVGYSNEFPGGYGERMLLSAPLLLEVPNGLDPRWAALTEPMAVGAHAVAKSGIAPGDAALVLGCGPVGLAVIASLRLAGIEPIVAADFSPARRTLATTMGAHEVVDPRQEPGIDAWQRVDGTRPLVVFEAVGVPGMLQSALQDAPRGSRIVVVGVCMEEDRILPILGINKELNIQFVLAYQPNEFADTLLAIADGRLDVEPLITGSVGIDEVPGAFDALADPENHCKILVQP